MVVVFVNKDYINIFYAYFASIIITFIILTLYSFKFVKLLYHSPIKIFTGKLSKQLLIFSLPLLGTSFFNLLISYTDTLMLGGIKDSVSVGLYNGAFPLAIFVTFPLTALITIFMPIFSGLYAKKLFSEIKRNYLIITKWLCLTTLPIFLILFLYPEQIIYFFFGSSYIVAANALRILALGFIINNFLGPNGTTLISMGKSLFILSATLMAVVLNIILNITLIPMYGIFGAALASAIALVSVNSIKGVKLYLIDKIHPLSKNLIRPTLLSLVLIIGLHFVLINFIRITIWLTPILFVIYSIILLSTVLFTKSMDQEDLKLLEIIEKKTGFRSRLIKKLISKFV
jgi:O-antigen/teichoic acid export membrane protein